MIYNHFCNPSTDAKSNRTGIQLLGVVVANCLPPYDPATAGAIEEQKFYTTFVSLMSHKYKELYAAAAEVLGMVLAFMDEKHHVCMCAKLPQKSVYCVKSMLMKLWLYILQTADVFGQSTGAGYQSTLKSV